MTSRRAGHLNDSGSIPDRTRFFLPLFELLIPALVPTQILFAREQIVRNVELNTYFYILRKLRMSGGIPPFPNIPSWCA